LPADPPQARPRTTLVSRRSQSSASVDAIRHRAYTFVVALVAASSLALSACGWRDFVGDPRPVDTRIEWKRSIAVGRPSAGRLVGGVRLPREGVHFFTWDPVKRRSPNRPWRRYGTHQLVRLILRIAREHRRANPGAPRVAVGDLSRPHGGDFGPQFGYIGHASHQNGLDVDIYYPRADGRERAPRDASQIDRALSQELVERFVAAGAQAVFVGPNTKLTGPPGVVVPLINHDNHMHVRIAL
jgi:murein endopeptidase